MKEFKEGNRKERLWFVNEWAEYVKTHSDKDWSRQQAILINSQIHNTKYMKLSRKNYLKIKGEA
jgi:hypothetical protein